LSGYTIVNLKDLEDVVGSRVEGVEGRFGRQRLGSEHLGVSYFRYAPGVRSSKGHRHREQEEAYVVVGGSGRVKLDDEVRDVRQWDVIRVSPQTGARSRAATTGWR
jgi:uncharacterized cupin superfamily protein